MKKIILLSIVSLLAITSFAQQRSYYWTDKGNNCFDVEVYPELEFQYYTNGYKAGEPCSAVMLAYCYLCEHGTQRNIPKAKQIIDAWATKSDVTAMAAMKFYAPKQPGFDYSQSVGLVRVVFPFIEDFGESSNINKSYKSLVYLEKLCDEGKLIDIRERDARELMNRIKLYCNEQNLMNVSLSGLDYIETVTYAGYSYMANDTIKIMFDNCKTVEQADSLFHVLRDLYNEISPSGVIYAGGLMDIIRETREEWKSPAYSNFIVSVNQKDSLRCAESYALLSDSEKTDADKYIQEMLRSIYTPGVNSPKKEKEVYLKTLEEMYSWNASPDGDDMIRNMWTSLVAQDINKSIEQIGITNANDNRLLVNSFDDFVSYIMTPYFKMTPYFEAPEMSQDEYVEYLRNIIDDRICRMMCNVMINYKPIPDLINRYTQPDPNRQSYADYAEQFILEMNNIDKSIEPYLSNGKKSWIECSLDAKSDSVDLLIHKLAVLRYMENISFIELIGKIANNTAEYEDYTRINGIIEELMAISNDPDYVQLIELMGKIANNTETSRDVIEYPSYVRSRLINYRSLYPDNNYQIVIQFLAPYEHSALLRYQDECALKAVENLTIDSTKEEINAVLSMPMTKATKDVVKKKTKKSYLKSKAVE